MTANTPINVLVLVKGPEKYIFLFDDDNRTKVMRKLGKFASDPDLNFTWFDAATLSQKIRQLANTPKPRFDLTKGNG